MRIFVTGATGFLGRSLVNVLIRAGHSVVALVRDPGRARSMLPGDVELVPGDITERSTLIGTMEGADGVFHLAAWYEVGAIEEQAERINLAGTRNVLEQALASGAERIIYTSTLAVFSDTRGAAPDETFRFEGTHLSAYDRTKWLAHHRVAVPLIEAGAPVIILQPGVIYGPGDRSPTGRMLRDYLRRRLPVIPKGSAHCWGHVEDTARIHLEALERGRRGETYIVAGPCHTVEEALEIAERVTGIPAPRLRLSPTVLRLLSRVAASMSGFSARAAGTAEVLRVAAGVSYLGDSSKARRELGWDPRSLEEGFRTVLPRLIAEQH